MPPVVPATFCGSALDVLPWMPAIEFSGMPTASFRASVVCFCEMVVKRFWGIRNETTVTTDLE